MTYKIISTKTKLPKYNKRVLVWHPLVKIWYIGVFYEDGGEMDSGETEYGDYFVGENTCWYLSDGHTKWASLPPRQRTGRRE